ncbi:MAG: HsdR family type I site-specific deoxyribonuclease [Planctomycetota bacterium]
MSEYLFVEKPFLDQLAALDWKIIDQGQSIPTDPTVSLRTSFREVILKDVFRKNVRAINVLEDGRPWLTDKQLDDLYDELLSQPSHSLVEANEAVQTLLYRTQVDVNELTGEQYPNVKLIDFHHPERNHFLAINQFRIDTPGAVKGFIIPDIVLFVNGIPLVVIECKDDSTSNPMFEAFQQLMRYSDQREETKLAGMREGEPRLFYPNQLLIRTCGEKADFGSVTSTNEEFFFPWRDIFPEKYRNYTPPLGTVRPQEVLIQGMLPKETLLDIIRTCTVFKDVGKSRAKIVGRYQQYRAVQKIIALLHSGQTPDDRSGVIWHTQGSGKSLTMVFLIRKLRMCEDLKDYKVCLINDRKDLEKQLGETAVLAGEKVTFISSSDELKTKLATDSSNLNMVMIHKFQEYANDLPDYLDEVLDIPVYQSFGLVNRSERILLMIDEAHRTQSGDLGDNLFEAFPSATRLAFTGTPLILVKNKKTTIERFGQYIDKYKLQDAVDDGATVQILYEGKTADTAIKDKTKFDEKVDTLAKEHVASQIRKDENQELLKKIAEKKNRPFEDLVKEHTDEEILALKKKWGTSGDLFEATERIEAIAADMVDHYVENILPNGFKAQVVCSSKMAAVHYKTYIEKAVAARLATEQAKPIWTGDPHDLTEEDRPCYRDDELCKQISFLKSAVVVSSEGTNERAVITTARKQAQSVDAVENFKRKFDYDDPEKVNTGVAFLIVCDMLLTGFDAPIEQVMYIDKKVKNHDLLQTIARVNRVAKGKTRGYIVDYIGLTDHLRDALSIYAADDQKDIENALKDISSEVPVLEARYQRLVNLFKELGVAEIEGFAQQTIADPQHTYEVLEQAIEAMKDLKQRTNFDVYLKKFLQSMDIILPNAAANPFKIPVKRFGYLLVKVKDRYKDDSLSISGAGEKVRKLINEHLISLGINPKIKPVELMSPKFIQELNKHKSPKAKASEMEHAIRKHCKVHLEEDPVLYAKLSEKLEALIKQYADNWEQLFEHLKNLRNEAEAGRRGEIEGVSEKAAPFYDLIGLIAFGNSGVPANHAAAVKQLVADVLEKLQRTIGIVNFWGNPPEVSELKGELADLMLLSNVAEIEEKSERIVTEITALAKTRHKDILG